MKNAVAIRLGPRESTPELRASLRKASVQAVREKLAEHSRISAKTWIYVGKELIGTKRAADEDGPKVFAGLFASSTPERSEALRYPFSLATGRKLISIAQSLSRIPTVNSAHNLSNSECLPSSWGTLYELSRLPTERLAELIESGAVHPMMTRAEAAKLAARKRRAAKNNPEAQAYRAARRLFMKIEEPRRRAAEFVNLMHDCGLTLEQLQEIEE